MSRHTDMLRCRTRVLGALSAQMENRHNDPDWIASERYAVATAANEWAQAHGYRTVTVADVERLEQTAVGHVDYVSKLCLRVAEAVVYGEDQNP